MVWVISASIKAVNPDRSEGQNGEKLEALLSPHILIHWAACLSALHRITTGLFFHCFLLCCSFSSGAEMLRQHI